MEITAKTIVEVFFRRRIFSLMYVTFFRPAYLNEKITVFPKIKNTRLTRALLRECEVQKDDEAQNDSVGTEDSEVPLSDVVHEFLNDHHGHDEADYGAQGD